MRGMCCLTWWCRASVSEQAKKAHPSPPTWERQREQTYEGKRVTLWLIELLAISLRGMKNYVCDRVPSAHSPVGHRSTAQLRPHPAWKDRTFAAASLLQRQIVCFLQAGGPQKKNTELLMP